MKFNSTVHQIAHNVARASVIANRNKARAMLDEYARSTPVPSDPAAAEEMQATLIAAYAKINDYELGHQEYSKYYGEFFVRSASLPEPESPRQPSVHEFSAPPLVANAWWKGFLPWEDLTDWDETNRRTKEAWDAFHRDEEQRSKEYEEKLMEAYLQVFGMSREEVHDKKSEALQSVTRTLLTEAQRENMKERNEISDRFVGWCLRGPPGKQELVPSSMGFASRFEDQVSGSNV